MWLCRATYQIRLHAPDLLFYVHSSLCTPGMTTNEPPPLRAVLRSMIAITIVPLFCTDHRPDFEIEGIKKDGKQNRRSWYFVQLHVASKEVVRSTKKPASSELRWEWNGDNQMCVWSSE